MGLNYRSLDWWSLDFRHQQVENSTPEVGSSKLLQEPPGPSSGRLATSMPGPEKKTGKKTWENINIQHPTSKKYIYLSCFYELFPYGFVQDYIIIYIYILYIVIYTIYWYLLYNYYIIFQFPVSSLVSTSSLWMPRRLPRAMPRISPPCRLCATWAKSTILHPRVGT